MKRAVLGELCDFFNGGAWSDKEYVNAGIPVLKVTNCKSTGFQLDGLNYLSEKSREKYKKNELVIGDVIIATVGSHPNLIESAAGRSCIVNSQVEGFYLNQNAVCVRTKDKKVLSQKYLGYLCKCADFQHYIQSRGRGAANQMRIAISSIKEYSFTLPDIQNQHYIADILSTYDDIIENNQKQIKLLEEAAQRLYKEWFVDLRFPGHENTKIVDGVPEEWRKFPLEEIAPVVTGKKDANYGDKGGNYPFFTCSQETITAPGYSFDTSAVILAGNGDFNVKLYRGKFEAYQRTYVLAPFDHSNLFNLYFTVQDNMEALTKGASGSTIKFLTKGMLQKILVLTADKKILDKFNDYEENIQQKVEALKKQVEDLTEIRNRLLPKLMSGEVEV